MSNSTTAQLTRREFVAASGAFTGALMMPVSLLAAPPAASGTWARAGFARLCGLRCEFNNLAGILRPSAWRLPGGLNLELIPAIDGGGIRLSNPFGSDEYFRADDLRLGRPQEIIRHRFGDDVLRQVIEEVDRRRAEV